jgi:glycerol-3-phosphate dehydrogenase
MVNGTPKPVTQNATGLPSRDPSTQRLSGLELQAAPDGQAFSLAAYDLIVIGGGINGCGIARDAAERGLRVLLLEKNDFGSGTSAYSSRLIHGGLRYLAHFEFDLVRESLRERERLLQNAPHLVRPLAMAVPIYKGAKNARWMIALGLMLYDWFAGSRRLPKHRMYSRQALLAQYPGLNPEGLQGGAVYFDAQVAFPERVCVENAMAAAATGYATVLNHALVTAISVEEAAATRVRFTDLLSGAACSAMGRVVINAAGPWVDAVLDGVERAPNRDEPLIGGTEGSHIVVRRFPNGPETALYTEAESDGRPFFILPWLERYYLIGTTDRRYRGDLDAVAAEPDEVAYLLQETNRVLPGARLTLADVLYTYAGIRPLPYVPEHAHRKEGAITRRHLIHDHGQSYRNQSQRPIPRLISVIGGKLTTYRALAQEVVEYAVKRYAVRLPNPAQKKPAIPASTTAHTPLPGGKNIPNQRLSDFAAYQTRHALSASRTYDVPEAVARHLIDLYGSRFESVLALILENPLLRQPLAPSGGLNNTNGLASPPETRSTDGPHGLDIGAQVVFAVREELACTVSDVMLRRIGCGLQGDAGLETVEAVALIMGRELEWPPERIQAEVNAYRHYVEKRAIWRFARLVPQSRKPGAGALESCFKID